MVPRAWFFGTFSCRFLLAPTTTFLGRLCIRVDLLLGATTLFGSRRDIVGAGSVSVSTCSWSFLPTACFGGRSGSRIVTIGSGSGRILRRTLFFLWRSRSLWLCVGSEICVCSWARYSIVVGRF
jgi:hypothetical protein